MEKFLRPERFDGGDASTGDWVHWLKTFTNFVSALGREAQDKLMLPTKYMSTFVYTHIRNCSTQYDEAIKILQPVYVKPVYEVFAQ